MAWSTLANDSVSLSIGDQLRVQLTFGYIPPMYPSDAEMIAALNEGGNWEVSSIEHPALDLFGTWKIEGKMLRSVTVGELKAMVTNSLNVWYTWNIQIQKVEIGVGFRPEDLIPDVSLTMSLVAVALIAIVGFVFYKELT